MPSPRPRRSFALALALAFALPLTLQAQEPYKSPPPEIVAILDAPPFPTALVSPDKLSLLLVEQPSLPALAEVGQPMLRLAGLRINPNTNGSARTNGRLSALVIERLADGARRAEQVGRADSSDGEVSDRVAGSLRERRFEESEVAAEDHVDVGR